MSSWSATARRRWCSVKFLLSSQQGSPHSTWSCQEASSVTAAPAPSGRTHCPCRMAAPATQPSTQSEVKWSKNCSSRRQRYTGENSRASRSRASRAASMVAPRAGSSGSVGVGCGVVASGVVASGVVDGVVASGVVDDDELATGARELVFGSSGVVELATGARVVVDGSSDVVLSRLSMMETMTASGRGIVGDSSLGAVAL
mmetsp:Transcript_10647/g.32282  ORF Transcript_10647/g.32282 Transcript_10647/m.32282 type:complete len:201 (+) Transcript_10647:814-1416(+)